MPPRQSWREAFDCTENEATLVVALINARLLGYDGATAQEMIQAGVPRDSVEHIARVVRLRLVELVGFTDEPRPRKVWGPTSTAFRRFGVAEPEWTRPETSAAQHSDAMLARARQSKNAWQRQRRVA
jgi:hypothetical protein